MVMLTLLVKNIKKWILLFKKLHGTKVYPGIWFYAMLLVYFMDASWMPHAKLMLKWCFGGFSWFLHGCFNNAYRNLPGCFKEPSRMIQGSLRYNSRMPQGNFKSASIISPGCLNNDVSGILQGFLKLASRIRQGTLRLLHRCFERPQRFFKDASLMPRMLQEVKNPTISRSQLLTFNLIHFP